MRSVRALNALVLARLLPPGSDEHPSEGEQEGLPQERPRGLPVHDGAMSSTKTETSMTLQRASLSDCSLRYLT